jgi:hypothetical protein
MIYCLKTEFLKIIIFFGIFRVIFLSHFLMFLSHFNSFFFCIILRFLGHQVPGTSYYTLPSIDPVLNL